MRRVLLFGAIAIGVAMGARRIARGCGGVDFEQRVERMPENSPRRWMVRNISAIREDAERILELLERERAGAPGQPTGTPA